MSLLVDVLNHLDGRNVRSALIGGVALAAHGIARATLDTDLLVVDASVLAENFWQAFHGSGEREVTRGDAADALAGSVRWSRGDEVVDVVVGRPGWPAAVLERRTFISVQGHSIPVVSRADLVLLKLFAGGPQDLVDVQLLLASDPQGLAREVGERLAAVPAAVRAAWRRVREHSAGST